MPTAALAGFFHPASLKPAAPFQTIERRIERGNAESNCAGRAIAAWLDPACGQRSIAIGPLPGTTESRGTQRV